MGSSGCFAIVCCLAVTGAVLVLAVSLIVASIKKLDSKELGLQYDTIQKDLGDQVFTEGLHLGPVGYEFVKFDNIYTSMYFNDFKCLDNDGIQVQYLDYVIL